jgi:DNA-binding NtrC family response regulator
MGEYSWPGNVRELENICRRAATLCPGDVMTADLIEPWLAGSCESLEGVGPLREGRMLQDMERHLVERTLSRFNGHRAKSAKALGMGVRTLSMKLKQWREEAAAQAVAAGLNVR